jgi:hypothetical protein
MMEPQLEAELVLLVRVIRRTIKAVLWFMVAVVVLVIAGAVVSHRP